MKYNKIQMKIKYTCYINFYSLTIEFFQEIRTNIRKK